MKPKIFVTFKPTQEIYEAWYENENPGYVGQGPTPAAAVGSLLIDYPDMSHYQVVVKA